MIDVLASERHYADHLAPIYRALPDGSRGAFLVPRDLKSHVDGLGIAATYVRAAEVLSRRRPILVASYSDTKRARTMGRVALAFVEHGIGQSYGGDTKRRGAWHGSYAGGRDRDDVGLFLCPNEHAAARWREAYPEARVDVVGSPRVATLPARAPGDGPVVAVSWHWRCSIAPETRPAFPHFQRAVADLARTHRVIGHAHPRMIASLAPWYRRAGIEVVREFAEVCRRADVYACDNSSTLYEFAATGRPVVVLNAPWYRRDVQHGLRFWEAADVGIEIDDPADLAAGIELALEDPPDQAARRERALGIVYGVREGTARRAAAALVEWSRSLKEAR